MRKKLQGMMFEISYMFEWGIAVIVGAAVVIFGIQLIGDVINVSILGNADGTINDVLGGAITLAVGAELIKMLCKHTPETVIEVLAFALARNLIVEHTSPIENLITVSAIAVLFVIRRFLLRKGDMVENPDGLVEVDK